MSTGCNYVTHKTKRWNGKTKQFDTIDNHCNKYIASGESMCPKHLWTSEEKEKETERKRIAREQLKEQKKLREQELSSSPLSTFNEIEKPTRYERS